MPSFHSLRLVPTTIPDQGKKWSYQPQCRGSKKPSRKLNFMYDSSSIHTHVYLHSISQLTQPKPSHQS